MPGAFEAQEENKWGGNGGSEGERGGDEDRGDLVVSFYVYPPTLLLLLLGKGWVCLVSLYSLGVSTVPAIEWVPVTCLLNE